MTRFDRSMAWLARARQVVPGAAQTLSKGPGMFVEGAYPVFLERGRGCRVWDVDGHEYIDYLLGLASITLGYAYPVDRRGGNPPDGARQHLLAAASARGGGRGTTARRSSRAPRWRAS